MRRYCTVAVAIGFALMLPAAAHAETFTVAAPTEAALQDAVDAANDRDGADTVLLNGHTIMLAEDDIEVVDDLTLRGPGTLDGSGLESDAIIEAWANLTIEDVRLIGTNDERALLVLAPDAAVRVERSYVRRQRGRDRRLSVAAHRGRPCGPAARRGLAGRDRHDVRGQRRSVRRRHRHRFRPGADPGRRRAQHVRRQQGAQRRRGHGPRRRDQHLARQRSTVENSTFSGNSAAGPSFGSGGGAIAVNGSASTTLTHVTITGNTPRARPAAAASPGRGSTASGRSRSCPSPWSTRSWPATRPRSSRRSAPPPRWRCRPTTATSRSARWAATSRATPPAASAARATSRTPTRSSRRWPPTAG